MGRVKFLLLCLWLLCYAKIFAADTTLQLQPVKFLAGNYKNFYTDNLGNLFVITQTNQVKKYNSNGDSAGVFNDVKQYGNIAALNVTNPLKILVYYRDYGVVLILDRFLSVVSKIDLRSKGFQQVRAIALSYDSNIWLYDDLDAKLKKMDVNGNLLLESTDFRLLFDEVPHPMRIIDDDGQLYLYDTASGWFIFDYYGALKTKLAFTNWLDVSVKDNTLNGRQNITMFSYQPKLLQLSSAKLNVLNDKIIKVQQQLNNIYVLNDEGVTVYKITNQH